jgi:glycosyltransferase involved in cell wall biosynthesis
LVPHQELLSRITEHDIGLAVEEVRPDSRNLTITNKILQYLLGGIAVIASDTAGQREVATLAPDAVFLFKNYDSDDLSLKINSLIADKALLENAKKSALSIASKIFCWEHQEKLLVNWINEVT